MASPTTPRFSRYRDALSITSQFYFCGIPFRLDTTAKCSLNCLYCFAMSRGGRRTSNALLVDVEKVRRKLRKVFETCGPPRDAVGEMLARRVPVHFGGISDPFADRRIARVSRNLLKLLGRYDYPVVISTKNIQELLRDETLRVLGGLSHLVVQISITTPDSALSRRIEPSAASPEDRARCIQTLSREGVHCICRLQPLLFTEIEAVNAELIPMLSDANCKHVVVEFLKLPVERNVSLINTLLQSLRWDAYDFYKTNGATLVGREWILPNRFKWERLQPILEGIRSHRMTYGAGDYGLHHLGDTDCCCGLDGLPGFCNWFGGNFANVIRNSSRDHIMFEQLEKHWFPRSSIKRVLNSNCRLPGANHKVLDYLRNKWNSPGTANAPDSFLGVQWEGDHDVRGNCVYVKHQVM